MVYPDIFIKTLIKQKLICGIVLEFKREKNMVELQSHCSPEALYP